MESLYCNFHRRGSHVGRVFLLVALAEFFHVFGGVPANQGKPAVGSLFGGKMAGSEPQERQRRNSGQMLALTFDNDPEMQNKELFHEEQYICSPKT